VSVAIVGANGRSGAALCRALKAAGRPFVPVLRNAAHWIATGITNEASFADLEDAPALRRALEGATVVVSTAPAAFAPAILAAAPAAARFVFLGSTRRFSRWPDDHAERVRAGEAAFLASGRPGVMLHATMIYGATGEDNVQRLARLLKVLPVGPLPDGGTALVQPIHQDDVTRCLLAALDIAWAGPETLVVAGPEAVAYRDFLDAVARAAGLPTPHVVPVPSRLLQRLAPATRFLPFVPRIEVEEVRRLTEDKVFDVGPMRDRLGVVGRPLAEGLAQTFARR